MHELLFGRLPFEFMKKGNKMDGREMIRERKYCTRMTPDTAKCCGPRDIMLDLWILAQKCMDDIPDNRPKSINFGIKALES